MRRLLAAIILVAAASSPTSAQCSDVEKKRLEEFDRAWGEATTRGDRAMLQTILADDYAGATPTGVTGKVTTIDDAVLQAERNRTNPSAPRTLYDNYVTTCTPTTATVTHRNMTTTMVGGREQAGYSRSVHVLERRGGRWQVVGGGGHPLTDSFVLLYMENDWNDAWKRKDVAWFERNYADDATDISAQTGAIMTKAAAIASLKAGTDVLESLELSETSVRVEGNAAIVTGVNRVKGRDAQGKPFDRRVRFTDTFIRRDGRWLVWATQGTAIP